MNRTKKCVTCGKLKRFSQFRPNSTHPEGVNKRCLACIKKRIENGKKARDKGTPVSYKIKEYFQKKGICNES